MEHVKFNEWLELREFNQMTNALYHKAFQKAKETGFLKPATDVFPQDWFPKVGLDLQQLTQAGVMQDAGNGTFRLNKDLMAVRNSGGIPNNPNPPYPPFPHGGKVFGWSGPDKSRNANGYPSPPPPPGRRV